jgi:hypothetical protein
MGLDEYRLVLEFSLFMGLGAVSLWTLGSHKELDLGPGKRVGLVVGLLAHGAGIFWLGSAAA